mmetsp:Transcript_65151/g.160423  ORF Transcript_65151/g.160423 Transcript_65151/m.160423 type:complete len:95 (-) Transcript_65151:338-622(-)
MIEEWRGENPAEVNNDRHEFWQECQKMEQEYADGTREIQPGLLVRKKKQDTIPTKGNAPEGFLMKFKAANKSLNPFSTAQAEMPKGGKAVKVKK